MSGERAFHKKEGYLHYKAHGSIHGIVSRIQRFSLNDGPGLRTTVFLQGCPLRCVWCHNPETQPKQGVLMIMENRCIGCTACLQVCPALSERRREALEEFRRAKRPTVPYNCLACGRCVVVCPTSAREWSGRRIDVQTLVSQLERDRQFFDASNGGVTLSGGEPLMQAEFTAAIARALREEHIHVALDTSGYAEPELFSWIIEFVDLVLFDLKLVDSGRFRQWCGGDNSLIFANLDQLDRSGIEYWVRIPLVPGINDTDEELAGFLEILKGLKNCRQVSLLPYHKSGLSKYARLGRTYQLERLQPPSEEKVAEVKKCLSSAGLPVLVGF